LTFQFHTRKDAPTEAPKPAASPTCAEVLDMFAPVRTLEHAGEPGAGCASSSCHGADQRMGLHLEDVPGLLETAINRVAHETDSGSKTGTVVAYPPRFGVDMAVIAPFKPENSYLMYKLALKPENYRDDATGETCFSSYPLLPPPATCPEDLGDEAARLGDAFVKGSPMPLDPSRSIDARKIQAWIKAGATCP
jgi:hypothetical protein